MLLDDKDEAVGLDRFVSCVEFFARANFFEHIVDLREGKAGMFGLDLFAQSVEFLCYCADARFEGFRSVGKGEWVEATNLRVNWSIFQCTTIGQRPNNMYPG